MYDKFKRLCTARGVTPYRVAKETGISTATLSQWKNGVYTPKIQTIAAIAAYFGVPLDYFVEDSPQELDPSTDHSHWIPVLGRVAAGVPIGMVEDILDYEEVDNSMGETFALQVNGDSMSPQLLNGDVIIVHRQPDVENGEIAVVAVDGEDATCKKIVKSQQGVVLVPLNPWYDAAFFSNEDILAKPITILGRVVEIRRKL